MLTRRKDDRTEATSHAARFVVARTHEVWGREVRLGRHGASWCLRIRTKHHDRFTLRGRSSRRLTASKASPLAPSPTLGVGAAAPNLLPSARQRVMHQARLSQPSCVPQAHDEAANVPQWLVMHDEFVSLELDHDEAPKQRSESSSSGQTVRNFDDGHHEHSACSQRRSTMAQTCGQHVRAF